MPSILIKLLVNENSLMCKMSHMVLFTVTYYLSVTSITIFQSEYNTTFQRSIVIPNYENFKIILVFGHIILLFLLA